MPGQGWRGQAVTISWIWSFSFAERGGGDACAAIRMCLMPLNWTLKTGQDGTLY